MSGESFDCLKRERDIYNTQPKYGPHVKLRIKHLIYGMKPMPWLAT